MIGIGACGVGPSGFYGAGYGVGALYINKEEYTWE